MRYLLPVLAAVGLLFVGSAPALAEPSPPTCAPGLPPGQAKKCVEPPAPTYTVTRTVHATGPLFGAGYYLECEGAGDFIESYDYTVTESRPGALVITREHVVAGSYGAVEILFEVPQEGDTVTITGSAVCSDAEPLNG